MKRQAFSLISLLGLLLMAGSAIAQTVHVCANIPFTFTAGNKTLPAGSYIVKNVGERDSKMLLLQANDGNASMIIGSNSAENLRPAAKSKLVFNQYRSQYFLAEIWEQGAARGHQLPKTSREKELAKELARGLPQRVEIVASLY